MKRQIFILSLFFAGIFVSHAQQYCDTLKWKTIQTNYGDINENSFYSIGELDGAVINIDMLSSFYPGVQVVNVSNDTFYSDETFTFFSITIPYTDTGAWEEIRGIITYSFGKNYNPNESMITGMHINIDLLYVIDLLKEEGFELEQISYWKLITGILYTSKDGYYSERVFFEGADTATFRVVRAPVNTLDIQDKQNEISIFPNPAQTQFTVTNAENANIILYNLLGQKIKQIQGEGENTIIQIENLPAGMYILKVEKGSSILTRKVQIVK